MSQDFATARTPITKLELSRIQSTLSSIPDFPGNVLNGCQARAHVLYRTLDTIVPGKIYKAWIFTGQLLSPMFVSSIDYRPAVGPTVKWDFHVAVAFTVAGGKTMVVDTLFSPQPQPLEAWTRRFRFNGRAVQAFLPGPLYSYVHQHQRAQRHVRLRGNHPTRARWREGDRGGRARSGVPRGQRGRMPVEEESSERDRLDGGRVTVLTDAYLQRSTRRRYRMQETPRK